MSWIAMSDLHFGHNSILDFERGDAFSTIEQHDEQLVELIERKLKRLSSCHDEFWFLGDWGLLREDLFEKMVRIFATAKCRKYAILGNHDGGEETKKQLEKLFDRVYDYPQYISNRIVLSHFPCAVWGDQVNVHGHLHGSKLNSPNHICASVHVAGYKPITSNYVTAILGRGPRYNRRFLWEPWADMYQFTRKKPDVIMDKDRVIDLAASRVLQRLAENQDNSA